MNELYKLLTTTRQRMRYSVLAACFVVGWPCGVEACPVCLPFPTKTVADSLIDSEVVVFARENPEQPFSFTAIRVLKGQSDTSDIDYFADSMTRRRLRADKDAVVVFVRANENHSWRSLGIADTEYQQVVQRILVFSNEWNGKNGPLKRSEYFLTVFGHENRAIHELAYLELGRVPYRMIKKIGRAVSPDELRPMLTRREYFEWRSLAILMLVQKADRQDRELIEHSFRDCRRFSLTTNLSAWATAYIELNGVSAVKEIEATYLCNGDRTEAEVRAVITALSVHGRDGHTYLRDQIVKSYGTALRFHPQVAGLIAADLNEWKKWMYRDEVAGVLAKTSTPFDAPDTTAIRKYLK